MNCCVLKQRPIHNLEVIYHLLGQHVSFTAASGLVCLLLIVKP